MVVNDEILHRQFTLVEQKFADAKSLIADSDLMDCFSKDFAMRFCWSSNAIEGNTLSLDDTVALVEYDEVRAGHTYTEYQEAKNLYRAINDMLIPFHSTWIDEAWIIEANSLIRGTEETYRTKNVRIGSVIETIYTPPDFSRVPELMKAFLSTANFDEPSPEEAIKQIAVQHIRFERIHPFSDGNGRTGRMVLNQQLINHGFLPVALTKNSAYRQSLRLYDRNGDYSKLLHILLEEEEASIDRLGAFERQIKQAIFRDDEISPDDI